MKKNKTTFLHDNKRKVEVRTEEEAKKVEMITKSIMQKVINVLAVLSFVGTAGIVGGGTAVYLNKDSIVENIKSQVAAAAGEAITGALPGMMDSAMPELPDATGGAIPVMPSATGGAIPSLPF